MLGEKSSIMLQLFAKTLGIILSLDFDREDGFFSFFWNMEPFHGALTSLEDRVFRWIWLNGAKVVGCFILELNRGLCFFGKMKVLYYLEVTIFLVSKTIVHLTNDYFLSLLTIFLSSIMLKINRYIVKLFREKETIWKSNYTKEIQRF